MSNNTQTIYQVQYKLPHYKTGRWTIKYKGTNLEEAQKVKEDIEDKHVVAHAEILESEDGVEYSRKY